MRNKPVRYVREDPRRVGFGEWVYKERRALGLTQAALARMCNMHQATISMVELGKTVSEEAKQQIKNVLNKKKQQQESANNTAQRKPFLHIYKDADGMHAVLCDEHGEPTSVGIDWDGGLSVELTHLA